MDAKEKAVELYDKYYDIIEPNLLRSVSALEKDIVKASAFIAVDEILNEPDCSHDYWQEVKEEIEKL